MTEQNTNTSLESKTEGVEVKKGSLMLSREIMNLVYDTLVEQKTARSLEGYTGCIDKKSDLRKYSTINISDRKGLRIKIYTDPDKRDVQIVHKGICEPISINAYNPSALEQAKVFAKSYKELTGANAVVIQQFIPEDFIEVPEVKTAKSEESNLEERTASKKRTEVKFGGSPKPKENHGFLRGFYTATAGELAAKALMVVLSAVAGYVVSEYKHNTEAQPAAQVSEWQETYTNLSPEEQERYDQERYNNIVEKIERDVLNAPAEKGPFTNEIYNIKFIDLPDEKPAEEKLKIRFD